MTEVKRVMSYLAHGWVPLLGHCIQWCLYGLFLLRSPHLLQAIPMHWVLFKVVDSQLLYAQVPIRLQKTPFSSCCLAHTCFLLHEYSLFHSAFRAFQGWVRGVSGSPNPGRYMPGSLDGSLNHPISLMGSHSLFPLGGRKRQLALQW